jgi:uncharacterized protein YbaP (TraB family)
MIAEIPLSGFNRARQFRRSKPDQTESDTNRKFMQTIGAEMFKELERIASEKGIRVQTLLRAVIIPEWVQRQRLSKNTRWNPVEPQTSIGERRSDARSHAL